MELKQNKTEFMYIDQAAKTTVQRTKLYNIHYAALKQYGKEYQGCNYLEIGTNYGHSAFQAWSAFKPNCMILCDLFDDKRMIPFVERVLVTIGCTAKVMFVSGDTMDSLSIIRRRRFEVILVDGDHTNYGATRDLRNAWKMLEDDGIIIFDDLNLPRLEKVFDNFVDSVDGIEWVKKHKEWKHGCAVVKKEAK